MKAICVEAGMLALRRDATLIHHEDFMASPSLPYPSSAYTHTHTAHTRAFTDASIRARARSMYAPQAGLGSLGFGL